MRIQGNHIIAEEGKILRRISDQKECGKEVYLGYAYYLNGEKLDEPLQELPEHYEEMNDPDYNPEEAVSITRGELSVMNRSISLLSSFSAMSINTMSLDGETALEFADIYPEWGNILGTGADAGFRFRNEGVLYEVLTPHTLSREWVPGNATLSLYKPVTRKQEEETGTEDNPIAWVQGMELFEGKYYTDKGILYRCTRSSGIPMAYNLEALAGTYVEEVPR